MLSRLRVIAYAAGMSWQRLLVDPSGNLHSGTMHGKEVNYAEQSFPVEFDLSLNPSSHLTSDRFGLPSIPACRLTHNLHLAALGPRWPDRCANARMLPEQ